MEEDQRRLSLLTELEQLTDSTRVTCTIPVKEKYFQNCTFIMTRNDPRLFTHTQTVAAGPLILD